MKNMKKSVKILIMVAIVLMIAGVTVWAATLGKANSSYVRIREKATTESEVLDVLMEGDQVEILGEEGDWYKVSAKGHTGYVSKAFITKNGSTDANTDNNTNNNTDNNTDNNTNQNTDNNSNGSENTTKTNQTATITTRVYKVAEQTDVYILPILSAESIGTVNAGEDLDLLSSAGLWGYIKTDKIKGWVRIDKLSSEEVETTVTEETTTEETTENNEENNTTETTTENNEENKATETENNATETNNEENNTSTENNETTTSENNTETIYDAEKTMYVSATAINVRASANTTSDVISGATLNASFTVVGESNGWYKVKVNGSYGYIRKDLLSDSKTEETSRSNSADRTEAAKQTTTATETKTASDNTSKDTTTTSSENTTASTTTSTETNTASASTTSTATNTTTASTSSSSSSSVTGEDIVAYAKQFLGCKYVYGAAGPNSFDCSGFTMYVYKHFGYSLSHYSGAQATEGKAVTGELQAGDILIFATTAGGSKVGHVGLYIGNDKFIHASDSTTGVIISNLHDSWNINKYLGARRIL